jgi:SAM-dependent methyltransferase
MTMNSGSNTEQTCCPVCASQRITDCIHIPQVPIYCNVLYERRDEALTAQTGDIDLCYCENCGHLYNRSFDPARVDYSAEYENSLHYSGRFRDYAQSLAEELIDRHDLHHKTVIEIACGKGDFLELLCALGNNRGIGFDPSHVPGRQHEAVGAGLTFIRDYYSSAYRDYRADLVCCRHALEHMGRPSDFLRTLRDAIGNHASAVFFEVPNALFTLRDLGIWDLIYEHCGYFSEYSLREVFRRSGFSVTQIRAEFGGQFLSVHALPEVNGTASPQEPPAELGTWVRSFTHHYESKVKSWQDTLRDLQGKGLRTVLWGAGSKGVSFTNILQITEEIGCLIDLNPHKQGRYVPGTGHQVHSPDFLTEYRPDTVIVMNSLYSDEIRQQLAGMGLQPRIIEDLPSPQRIAP